MAELKDILKSGVVDTEILTATHARFVSESPGDVTTGAPTSLATLHARVPPGLYEITVSLVTAYTTANDKFRWNVAGSYVSPTFLKECKDPTDSIPIAYAFPVQWSGGDLHVEIIGEALDRTVVVPAVNVLVKRIL